MFFSVETFRLLSIEPLFYDTCVTGLGNDIDVCDGDIC